jgi:hypothetical protein
MRAFDCGRIAAAFSTAGTSCRRTLCTTVLTVEELSPVITAIITALMASMWWR